MDKGDGKDTMESFLTLNGERTTSKEFNVLVLSNINKYIRYNLIFEGYCDGIKANSKNYYFIDYTDLYIESGKKKFEERIEKLVIRERINYIFFILQTADLTFDIYFIEKLSKLAFIVMHFCDTEYSFEGCDRYYAQVADLVFLPDYLSKYRYELLNINAICNFSLFNKNHYCPLKNIDGSIDVSFVGHIYSNRKEYIEYLIQNQISIELYGKGTSNGIIDFEKMVEVFNNSKINLNFTGTEMRGAPLYLNINSRIKQSKGRPIEIALCGGFVLSEYARGMENMFEIGKEIDVFHTKEELVQKVKYYFENEEERKEIAKRGYKRALRDYDTSVGFAKIFSIIANQSRNKKVIYLDDEFIENYTSCRFLYIVPFILNGKFMNLFEEFLILLKYRKVNFRKAYKYFLLPISSLLNHHPELKYKLKKVLRALSLYRNEREFDITG